MEQGSFRCDANISVRPKGSTELGVKVEVKNMNSFRSVYRALQYENERQVRMARDGQVIAQETRGWLEDRGVTVSQRSKEYDSDYRYFPEPDLPPLAIDPAWVEQVRGRLPELPQARKARLVEQYGLGLYDAGLLTASRGTADFFESVMAVRPREGEARKLLAKSVSNWVLGELARLLNVTGAGLQDIKVQPQQLIEMLDLIDAGTLSTGMAREVFEEMFKTGQSPTTIAEEGGMVQLSDVAAIQPAVEDAISGNPKPVADYLGGRETAMRFLVGQVMKATRGKADPQMAARLLRETLESMR
jgi:aspartyl-tRNA(Asn)/glutamyl-tRNA(Gln) amidotransferase subunit B